VTSSRPNEASRREAFIHRFGSTLNPDLHFHCVDRH